MSVHASGASSGAGLEALAQAAVLRSRNDNNTSAVPVASRPKRSTTPPIYQAPKRSCCQPSPPPRRLELPPLNLMTDDTPPASAVHHAFPTIPSISTITSLAGTGCTCGFECSCPGCVEHRGPQHASTSGSKDCASGPCENCVDSTLDARLNAQADPGAQSSLDRFFAQAAALPLPPRERRSSSRIDPGNVTVYPADLFSASAIEEYKRSKAFGLVVVPKLECCGGQCGCPDGACSCDHECGGNCSRHAHARKTRSPSVSVPRAESSVEAPVASTSQPAAASCCCG